jgi:type I restriction enzyme M protein
MTPEAQRRLGHPLDGIRSIQGFTVVTPIHAWRSDGEIPGAYADIAGFCCSAKLEEIEKNGFMLTPGRYVGAAEQDVDDEPFDQMMKRLTALLKQQQKDGAKLDQQIDDNLRRLGYEF